MSTMYVDTINEKTSGNGVIIPGHVVQFQKYASNVASIATSSTSYVNAGLSCSFTPKYSTSLLKIELKSRRFNLVTGHVMQVAVSRNGGSTFIGDGYTGTNEIYYENRNSTGSNQIAYGLYFPWIDEPNTTSTLTYQVYFRENTTSSGTVYLADSGGIQVYITEIAQ